MASTYEYITVALLEAKSGIDYSGIDAGYTDAFIEAQITAAEEVINGICGQSFTGTIPDGVKVATKVLAQELMEHILVGDKYWTEIQYNKQLDDRLIEMSLSRNFYSPVDSIAMSGIDRY